MCFPGQLFIYHTIKAYGALLFATVMTTRQFLSILLSCILFVHPLSGLQWVGTIMVFGTLYYKAFGKKHDHHNKEASEDTASGSTSKERDVELAEKEAVPLVSAKDEYEKKDPFETK